MLSPEDHLLENTDLWCTDDVIGCLKDVFGRRDFLPQSYMIEWFAEHVCGKKLLSELCGNVFFILCGFDEKNLNVVC